MKKAVVLLTLLAASISGAAAQSTSDDARANLEAIYGIYHVGTYCQEQGIGFTSETLSQLKDMALDYEGQLADEAAEAQLWDATGKTAGLMVGMMSMDRDMMTVQCGQLATSVRAMSPKTEKPF